MAEQANHSNNNNSNNGSGNNNNRRNNNRRRHHNNRGRGGNSNQNNQNNRENNREASAQNNSGHNNNNNNHNRNRRPQHNNRPRQPQQPQSPMGQIDRLYEKYLNLLDQHLIARRKYHDLFYRADPAQKAKLERNFYGSLNDLRDFEERMTPDMKKLFEKRNNGHANDNIYSSNHELSLEGDEVDPEMTIEDPHYLQSQQAADYSDDVEESSGSMEDYLRYKGL